MANLKFNLVRFEDEATLTVFHDGRALVANDSHPYWDEILKGVTVDDDPSVVDLFDMTEVVADKFQRLSERVTVHSGRVFFDGDEVDNTLTQKVVEFLRQKVDDWKPLVAFMEKVMVNPEPHSREQLFDFLAHNAFSITQDGDIVGYKGLRSVSENGHHFRSYWEGRNSVTVDGVSSTGYVYQSLGSVVEMARSEVQHDPNQGCSQGLHISNFDYAKDYGDVVGLVHVNPRDVVSVPNEHEWQKVRACRYVLVDLVTEPFTSALVLSEDDAADEPDSEPQGKSFVGGVFTPAGDAPVVMNVTAGNSNFTMTSDGSAALNSATLSPGTLKTTSVDSTRDFRKGDYVTLVGNKWFGAGHTFDDLYQRGVSYGDTGTVASSSADPDGNVVVDFDARGISLMVSPACLELIEEDEDESYSWSTWEDDGGSSW
jgi:hypothetical protein